MSSTIAHYLDKMTQNDADFFKQLGSNIARFRKAQGMTQAHLATHLEISQQHMASFEKGLRKVPSSMLSHLAALFGISIEELIGIPESATKKRGPTPKLQQQMERITRLPRTKQKFVMEMLDTVIQQSATH